MGCQQLCRIWTTTNTSGEDHKSSKLEDRDEKNIQAEDGINILRPWVCYQPQQTGQQKQNIPTEPTKQEFSTRGDNAPGADWQNFPTQPPVCDGDDGISADLVRYILRTGGDCYTEEEAEKEAKRIISKVRTEGIKAGGNAIVHQVALQIFKSINQFEKTLWAKNT